MANKYNLYGGPGFAEGFASTFNAGISAGLKRNAEREAQIVDDSIAKWDTAKAEQTKVDKAAAENLRKAKGIVGSMSLPNYIEANDAVNHVAQQLSIYGNASTVRDDFAKAITRGAISVVKTPDATPEVSVVGEPTKREGVDGEMADLGMGEDTKAPTEKAVTAPVAKEEVDETPEGDETRRGFRETVRDFFGTSEKKINERAKARFDTYLSNNDIDQDEYNRVLSGETTNIIPTSNLRINTMRMEAAVVKMPSLSSINNLDDVRAIRAQVSGFGIKTTPEWDTALSDIEKFHTDNKYKDIDDLTSKGSVMATWSAIQNDDTVPAGYRETVNDLKDYYETSGSDSSSRITKNYVSTLYFKHEEAALKDPENQEAQQAFNLFKSDTMPRMLAAIKRVNPNESAPDLEQVLFDLSIAQNSENTDPSVINKLEKQRDAILRATRMKAEATAQGKYNEPKTFYDPEAGRILSVTETRDDNNKAVYTGENGEQLDVTGLVSVGEEALESRKAIEKNLNSEKKAYLDFTVQLTDTLSLADDLSELAKQTPQILTKAAGATAGILGGIKEVSTGITILGEFFKDGNEVIKEEDFYQRAGFDKSVMQKIADGTYQYPGKINEIYKKRMQFQAKSLLMTFRIGGLEGQSGNAMSNKDFERLQNIFNSGDLETYTSLVHDYMYGKIARAKRLEKNYLGAASVVNWEANNGLPFYSGSNQLKVDEMFTIENSNGRTARAYQNFSNDFVSPVQRGGGDGGKGAASAAMVEAARRELERRSTLND